MANTRFLYIAGYLKETVTDSQIIGWLEVYQQHGIEFDLVLIAGIRSYFTDRAVRRSKIKEANKKLRGRIYDVFSVKPTLPLYQVIVFFVLLGILARDMVAGSTIVVQIRSASANSALKWLKRVYPKLKIVYDVRGATAEEYVNAFQRPGVVIPPDVESAYFFQLNQELELLRISEKAFFVSSKLRDYFLAKTDLAAEKIEIVPCCADEAVFFPDTTARKKVRTVLGIGEQQVVLLYSGGLNMPWQIPGFVFELVAGLQRSNPDIFFMCLTPHQEIVDRSSRESGADCDRIWSGYVNYEGINDYLNAADFGLLFREDIPMNNVASPTKFAEYLMAGLPTLISKGIGDLSEFVETTPEAGCVVDNDSDSLVENVSTYLENFRIKKTETAKIGKVNFSKSNRSIQIIRIYKSFAGQ